MILLREKVIGQKISYTLGNPSMLTGGFNLPLCGKLLVVCEEMPSNTERQWRNLVNWMKPWITNGTTEFVGKYSNSFNGKNVSSFIILTNNDAFVISPRDRRYVMMDVSQKYLNNYKYFDELALCYEGPDSDLIGEAFYWNCIEEYEKYIKQNNGKPFNPQKNRPMTKTKQGTIIDHLHTLYVYLKREYLAKKFGIHKQLLSQFRGKYLEKLRFDADKKEIGNIPKYSNHNLDVLPRKISELLKDIGIMTYAGTGNKTTIPEISYEKLYEIFKKRSWIDEFDDFDECNEDQSESIKKLNSEEIIEIDDIEFLDEFIEKEEKFPLYKIEQMIPHFKGIDYHLKELNNINSLPNINIKKDTNKVMNLFKK